MIAAQKLKPANLSQTERVVLSGNTFVHKDAIRALGATWSKPDNGWIISASAIVNRASFCQSVNRMGGVMVSLEEA